MSQPKLLTEEAENLVAEARDRWKLPPQLVDYLRARIRRVEVEARAHLIRNDPRP